MLLGIKVDVEKERLEGIKGKMASVKGRAFAVLRLANEAYRFLMWARSEKWQYAKFLAKRIVELSDEIIQIANALGAEGINVNVEVEALKSDDPLKKVEAIIPLVNEIKSELASAMIVVLQSHEYDKESFSLVNYLNSFIGDRLLMIEEEARRLAERLHELLR